MKMKKVKVTVFVENKLGALVRVSNVFTRRSINISEITVKENPNPETSLICIIVDDKDMDMDYQQIDKQLRKIECVIDAQIELYN